MAENLSKNVFATIKKQLITGVYDEIGVCNISSIARSLGVSRTPVREAMLRLADEGFVVNVPNVGFLVQRMTTKKAQDLLELALSFELYAIYKIERQQLEINIPLLRDLLEKEVQFLDHDDYYELFQNNFAFHVSVLKTLGNDEIINLYTKLSDMTIHMGFASKKARTVQEETHKEHLEFLDSLIEKDYEKAKEMAIKHTENAKKRLVIS